MIVHEKPVSWYLEKIRNKEYFSQGMYGDGEWIAMFHEKIGGMNAENTVYSKELCDALEASMSFDDPNFYFSVSSCLRRADWTGIGEGKIDSWMKARGLENEFYEKDVWDKDMREGRGLEFIKLLREHNVAIVSNRALRGLDFLKYDAFFEVSYPNCYNEIDTTVDAILAYGKPGIYIVAMGLPAALLVQKLHGRLKDSWILDLGSIWDAFVGIGAQRGWRREMYADQIAYQNWKNQYLTGL